MLRHTLVLPFKAIAGMPEIYTQWSSRPDVVFHYVSSSPWQLHEPLAQLLCPPAFPDCTLHLRRVRLGGGNIFTAFQGGEGHKRAALTALFERYPDRRFVLIGDESELDPEIFSGLARDYPRQVVRIFIRDPDRDGLAPRYRRLFNGLPPGTAVVFRDPRQILDLLPPPIVTHLPRSRVVR
jgi:phosphatidate phosphatase APP1